MAKSMRNAFIRVTSINKTKDGIVEYNKEYIHSVLCEWASNCKLTYWFIEHTADDEVSITHYHIVIKFNNPVPFDNIKNKFPYGDIENCKSVKSCVQYLVHQNDLSKVQYSWDNVLTNCTDLSPFKIKTNAQQEVTIQSILERIDRGEIREFNQFIEIPIEIWSKYKVRIENALTYYRERIYMDKDRSINVVFMSGDTGTGKTSFAKEYCKKTGKSLCVSSTSNDPMQDYKGEDVLILDDLRDTDYKFTDLLKILDNHTKSTMKARYHNKAFIGDTIIITSYKPLNDWYFDVPKESKEQLYRRIKSMYKFYSDRIELFEYSDAKHRYEKIAHLPNVIMQSKKEKALSGLNMLKAMGIEFTSEINEKIEDMIENCTESDWEEIENIELPFD